MGARPDRRNVLSAVLGAVLLSTAGCGDLYFAGSPNMAVGTKDLRCLRDVGVPEEVGGRLSFGSSAPEVIRVSPAFSPWCLVVEALTEGEAVISLEIGKGAGSMRVRAVTADHVALGEVGDARADPVLRPTAASYLSDRPYFTEVVWLAGDTLLRGTTDQGFTLTDPSVAELRYFLGQDLQRVEAISFLAPGTTQIFWNDLPGPVLNAVAPPW